MNQLKQKYLREDERLDQYYQSSSFIIQKPSGFRFNTDSVLLAQLARLKKDERVCDFGSGTGIIPIILANRRLDCRIIGLEIQKDIAEMAQRSLFLNNLQSRVSILHWDVLQAPSLLGYQTCSLVIANPPYRTIGQGRGSSSKGNLIARHAPQGALSAWIESAALCLKNKGRLAMILQADRLAELIQLSQAHSLQPKRMILIHPSLKEKPNLVFLESVKGANPGLAIEPPLAIYDAKGEYTQEVKNIYQGRGRFDDCKK